METVTELRKYFAEFGGFTGGWHTILEGFERHGDAAVLTTFENSWISQHFSSYCVSLGYGAVAIVIPWTWLVKQVQTAALRERLLVMISGNLNNKDWEKAVKFSKRDDGMVRRSMVGVHVGEGYWCPTKEQLDSVSVD